MALAISYIVIVPGPWWQQKPHHPHVYEQSSAANVVALFALTITIGLVAVLPIALRARGNAKNRAYNQRQETYLMDNLRMAEKQWIRQYSPPRTASR